MALAPSNDGQSRSLLISIEMRKPVRYRYPTGFLGYGGKMACSFLFVKLDLGFEIFTRNKLHSFRLRNLYLLQSFWINPLPCFPFDHLKGSESHQLNYFIFFDTGLDGVNHSCYRFLGFSLTYLGSDLFLYGFN